MRAPVARYSAARYSVMAIAAGLALTGCAKGASEEPTDAGATTNSYDPDAPLSGELSIMGFGINDEIGQVRYDAASAAIDPVKVSLIEGDLDIQQFLSAVAAGDPPEIIYANRDQIGTFASRGVIMPLDDCLEGEGVDTSMFRVPALNQVTFDDSVYGVPEFNQVEITMADSDLLSAAGLTMDDVNGSSWDAITAAADSLVSDDGGSLKVIGYDSKLPEFLPLWAKANGAELLSEDGKTAQLNSPEVVEALEFAVSIYDAQGGFAAVKAYRDSADFFGAGNQFATGTLGVMPMEQWYVNVLNDVSPDAAMDFDTFRDKSGNPIAYATGSAWAIPTDSANPVAACKFAATMTSVDTWMAAAQARVEARTAEGKPFTGLLTGNTTADEEIKALVTPSGDQWDDAVAATYEANDNTFSLPANPADAEFKTAWQDAVNRVLNGQQDAQAAMDEAQTTAQAALDKAWADSE